MNLHEQISRIQEVMGLNESSFPMSLRRRININPDKVLTDLKSKTFGIKGFNPKNPEIHKIVYKLVANDILFNSKIDEDDPETEKLAKILAEYLYEEFHTQLEEFQKEVFSNDDDHTYCFVKHKERHGGNGFSECVSGWNYFLTKFGSWLPNKNWSEVHEQLLSMPPKRHILLAKPLEGHIYEYYLSVFRLK